jgi:hypothetical protein
VHELGREGRNEEFLEKMKELEKEGECYFEKRHVQFEVKDVVAFLTSADGATEQVPTQGTIVLD